jgi:hypothetical protein
MLDVQNLHMRGVVERPHYKIIAYSLPIGKEAQSSVITTPTPAYAYHLLQARVLLRGKEYPLPTHARCTAHVVRQQDK